MTQRPRLPGAPSRRDFITVTLAGAGASALAGRGEAAPPKAMGVLHESSFIKPFDDFFEKTLAPEYEKHTGHQDQLRADQRGQHATRLTTIAETKSGPGDRGDRASTGRTSSTRASSTSATSPAEIGKKLGGWHDNILDAVVVNKKWKALPWGNIGQLEVYRTDWFKEVGVTKFPDTWEDLLAAGRLLKKKGHPFGFELGPRLRRQPRLDVSAALVVRRARGRQGRQDRPHRLRGDGARRSTSAASSTRRRCSRTCSAGPT